MQSPAPFYYGLLVKELQESREHCGVTDAEELESAVEGARVLRAKLEAERITVSALQEELGTLRVQGELQALKAERERWVAREQQWTA